MGCDVCGKWEDERTIGFTEVDGEIYNVCKTCKGYYDDEELADMLVSIEGK